MKANIWPFHLALISMKQPTGKWPSSLLDGCEVTLMKKYVWLLVSAALLTVWQSGAATAAFWTKKPVNTNWRGLALKGYDAVAYFTDGRPIEGQKDFETEWSGATWRFASAEHLELFKADPEKYAPQYGGY
jgi:YHS domain-containing protein